ncbi:MAG TPA: hypothetical protein VMW42_09915 [Desulfatiglandales bacterium]|nr:hypothetical protein [Desulfatiglandales bacterium]
MVYQQAYIPEHLPHYVEAISSAEPHLNDNHLCFTREKHLIFIGYPLGTVRYYAQQSYESACRHFRPSTVSVIAAELWFPDETYDLRSRDNYYRLELPLEPIDAELAYTVRRASRELEVSEGTFTSDHQRLVKDFISEHRLSLEHKLIFERIPRYLKRSKTARLLEARKGNSLVAFTIMDLGSADYAFYLFNFRSVKRNVPGASDLLFYKMVSLAQSENKMAINLGLGIHPGVLRFKEKWGGIPFLPYSYAFVRREPFEMGSMIDKL